MAIEKILNKRSNDVVTDGGVESPKKPTSSQLDNGEIAVNYHKGTERIFIKNDNEEIVDFMTKNEVEANYYDKDSTDTLLAGKQNTINDIATIRSGAQAGATAVQPSEITPIDNRLDNVEYCLGDYLKDIYVFNWENHTTTTTEPIYTTTTLWTVDGNHSFRTFSCRLTAGSATISALYLGKMDKTDTMYFTQSGTVTMYLALYSKPSTTDNLIRVYDASGNTVKIISTYEVPYSSQHVCTPFTFEVEPGYYLKIVAKVAGVPELIWLGQIDFEIAGVKQIDKDVHANSAAIEAIEQKIPAQASSSNKLVDGNSLASVATSGSYNDLSDKPTINTGVTSVGLTMPTTYFTVANSPITTSGTLSVSLKTGYTIPTTALLNSFVKCVTETVSITEDTLYNAGTITDQKHVFFVNSTTDTDFVVTIDNSSSFKTPDGHVLQLTVPANGYAECNFINVNGTIFVRGI